MTLADLKCPHCKYINGTVSAGDKSWQMKPLLCKGCKGILLPQTEWPPKVWHVPMTLVHSLNEDA